MQYPAKKVTRILDQGTIEGVMVTRPEKTIICVPCMIGCPLQCKMCKAQPFRRSLRPEEIIALIEQFTMDLRYDRPSLLSFMGVGEPSLNLYSIKEVIAHKAFDKYAISTTGVDKEIFKLPSTIKLQVSINAPNSRIRKFLMPNAPTLDEVLKNTQDLKNYDLNYVLIKNINDQPKHAKELADLLRAYGFNKVKINRYNETGIFQPSMQMMSFISRLRRFGIQAEYYETDGRDINAACGQMV